ncbi:AAA family ATPase [Kutzneria sp. CA-103260]|uniref:AAA family ATPase n=1 Tax=Kutzneria sp. CA-103260 TaxID=2802641 RepID=UPI001BF10543|nr:AAA family ATPase [Kutzneria sp. CA-103260]QUQ71641.1 Holliday junction ATP-dependent DNA helicase RuvB [Kutzneria sp. CA-103260]
MTGAGWDPFAEAERGASMGRTTVLTTPDGAWWLLNPGQPWLWWRGVGQWRPMAPPPDPAFRATARPAQLPGGQPMPQQPMPQQPMPQQAFPQQPAPQSVPQPGSLYPETPQQQPFPAQPQYPQAPVSQPFPTQQPVSQPFPAQQFPSQQFPAQPQPFPQPAAQPFPQPMQPAQPQSPPPLPQQGPPPLPQQQGPVAVAEALYGGGHFVRTGEAVAAFFDKAKRVILWADGIRHAENTAGQANPIILLVGQQHSGQRRLVRSFAPFMKATDAISEPDPVIKTAASLILSAKEQEKPLEAVVRAAISAAYQKTPVLMIENADALLADAGDRASMIDIIVEVAHDQDECAVLVLAGSPAFLKQLTDAAPAVAQRALVYHLPDFEQRSAAEVLLDVLAGERQASMTPQARAGLADLVTGGRAHRTMVGARRVEALLETACQSAIMRSVMPGLVRIDVADLAELRQAASGDGRKSAAELLNELNAMVGLDSVKSQVNNLVSELQVDERRRAAGMPIPQRSRHLVFTGNPGTAKTTMARVIAELYRELGVLAGGQLVECMRADLVGEYIGETSGKTRKLIEQAYGGVLFIDEAYNLVQGGDEDYGPEAVAELLAQMENHRDDLIVIVAGYPREMSTFLDSNPGLRSRFQTRIEFPDYSNEELGRIFQLMAKSQGYELGPDLLAGLPVRMSRISRGKGFANGRSARQLLEATISRQSARLAADPNSDVSSLNMLVANDIPAPGDIGVRMGAGGAQRSLPDLLSELDGMIGLEPVKRRVRAMVAEMDVDKQRRAQGLPVSARSRHLVFTGNPGTAKTTVARLIGEIYRELGVVTSGHVIEAQRSDLVAEHTGATAPKTRAVCEDALGGILFIDEAYTLTGEQGDFGAEAVAELLVQMENHRADMIVIVAGYPKLMDGFMETNPGLRSRFANRVEFPDYSNEELARIFLAMAQGQGYTTADDLVAALPDRIRLIPRGRGFANGRSARQLLEATLTQQSARLAGIGRADAATLNALTAADLPAPDEAGVAQGSGGRRKTLPELLSELDAMIGLEPVKQRVKAMVAEMDIDSKRRAAGMKTAERSRHLVFTGNPGTAKTTVARLIAQIYRELGVVSGGHVVETQRSDLVAEYIGQTAPKTRAVCESAMGGILFIDEAYTLITNGEKDFAPEAVAELLVQMENHRDDLIVIAAGYPKEMDEFMEANPGLRSRFANRVEFPDYSNEELARIFTAMAGGQGYQLAEDLVAALPQRITRIPRGRGFANGRSARQLLEATITKQSGRLAAAGDIEPSALNTLVADDLPAPEDSGVQQGDGGRRRGLAELLAELDGMIGLAPVKEQVRTLVAETRVDARRRSAGLKVAARSRHLVFTGNPGTAKTTVARLIAQLFRELGVLSSGHLVETGRPDLIAEYLGQTAGKTRAVCEKAIGGVLFIDEAYTLANGSEHDYGPEAIAEILVQMENHRDDLLVIAAGYPADMDRFLDANSGLRSRFGATVDFPDYTDEELVGIFEVMAKSQSYLLSDDLRTALPAAVAAIDRGVGFANGRSARGLLERTVARQAVRLAGPDVDLDALPDEELQTLHAVDLPG